MSGIAGKTLTDAATVTGAATAPLWLSYLNTGMTTVAGVGALVLVWLRVAIVWREWRAGHQRSKQTTIIL